MKYAEVSVVVGVRVHVIGDTADALERIDDKERGAGVLCEEALDLLLQTAAELFRHGGEIQIRRRVIRDVQQPVLDAGIAVLQTKVEHIAPHGGKFPHVIAHTVRRRVPASNGTWTASAARKRSARRINASSPTSPPRIRSKKISAASIAWTAEPW